MSQTRQQEQAKAAEIYEQAMSSYDLASFVNEEKVTPEAREKRTAALISLNNAAEMGHAPAQYTLAMCHLAGYVPCNNNRVSMLIKKAAAQQCVHAQHADQIMHDRKPATEQELKDTIQFYKAAAAKGDIQAQNLLGYCYQFGKGVPKLPEKAFEQYSAAATHNYPSALFNLANLHLHGIGTEKNPSKAIELYRKAADLHFQPAVLALARIYVQDHSSPGNRQQAVRILEEGVNDNNPYAQTELGQYYYEGNIVEEDLIKAAILFKSAANQGDTTAMTYLGLCYQRGHGVDRDVKTAFILLQEAATQGDSEGQYHLARGYHYGTYTQKKDTNQAIRWYRLAAEQGDVNAQRSLGLLYLNGNQGVTKDEHEAFHFLNQAAEQQDTVAQIRLAECYKDGIGVEQDTTKAIKLFQQAAKKGNTHAQVALGRMYKRATGELKDAKLAVEYFAKAAQSKDIEAQYELATCYADGTGVQEDIDKAIQMYQGIPHEYEPVKKSLCSLYERMLSSHRTQLNSIENEIENRLKELLNPEQSKVDINQLISVRNKFKLRCFTLPNIERKYHQDINQYEKLCILITASKHMIHTQFAKLCHHYATRLGLSPKKDAKAEEIFNSIETTIKQAHGQLSSMVKCYQGGLSRMKQIKTNLDGLSPADSEYKEKLAEQRAQLATLFSGFNAISFRLSNEKLNNEFSIQLFMEKITELRTQGHQTLKALVARMDSLERPPVQERVEKERAESLPKAACDKAEQERSQSPVNAQTLFAVPSAASTIEKGLQPMELDTSNDKRDFFCRYFS